MKWRSAVAAGFLLAGLSATPSSAGQTGQIILSGTRSASAIVHLKNTAHIACCEMAYGIENGKMTFGIRGLRVRTQGTYAGFVIERISDGRLVHGAVRVPSLDIDEGRVPTVITFGSGGKLRPGTYRFHLVTDGRSTLTIAAPGLGRDLFVRPSGPGRARGELVSLAKDMTNRTLQARVPVQVKDSSTVLLGVKTEGDYSQANYLSQCLTSAGQPCDNPDDHDAWAAPGSAKGSGTMLSVVEPGTVAAGPYDATFSAVSVGLQKEAYGFVLVFN